MKLLVLGGQGMAGHLIIEYFRRQGRHTVFYTTRDKSDEGGLLLDVTDCLKTENVLEAVRPQVIINAVGVLNQFAENDKINAYLV